MPTVTCATEAAECGSITDDCSQVIDCGTCDTGESCDGITQQCVADGTPICGDGNLDAGEDCDSGTNNSDADPDACRTDCTTARCGDGVADTGEDCDDGNAVNTDACTNLCGDSTHCDACVNADTCGVGNDCMSSFCAVPCDTSDADACPTDYTCADVSGTSLCAPDSGSCDPVTDPCDGVTCNTPGAPVCEGDAFRAYSGTGTCDGSSGAPVCGNYPSTLTDCDSPPA